MEHHFWHERWEENKLGFHQQKINSRLKKYWNHLGLQGDETVLVPLCGKSLDMCWLASLGHRTIGIEISPVACRGFFSENDLPFNATRQPPFEKFVSGNIELWCGDFFKLSENDLNPVQAVYDRAALIALPVPMRTQYVSHCASILKTGTRILLISMDYDNSKMEGPPFSVPEEEVRELFRRDFSLEIIARSSGPEIVGNLAQRGLDTLDEKVYLITRL